MYTLSMELISPTLLMSGQSDVNTDSTIIHDRYGIPYIPAKRVRGVLYESAIEVAEMLEQSGENYFTVNDVNRLFNHAKTDEPRLTISNLYIDQYDAVVRDIAILQEQYPFVFTKERILEEFTSVRYYTAIDTVTGTALEGSLHNSRVLNRGLVFYGMLSVDEMTDIERIILTLSIYHLSSIGAKRNRGFGHIKCNIDNILFDVQDVLKGEGLWSR